MIASFPDFYEALYVYATKLSLVVMEPCDDYLFILLIFVIIFGCQAPGDRPELVRFWYVGDLECADVGLLFKILDNYQ